jgi:hypothetical protein
MHYHNHPDDRCMQRRKERSAAINDGRRCVADISPQTAVAQSKSEWFQVSRS